MRPSRKHSKREAILDATLEVVVERGFHDAPMSLIAARSGASTGVIYHHFTSKEEILRALFERLDALKTASFLEGYSPEMDAQEAFIHVWCNLYRYNRRHQREMRFLDLYKSAGFAGQAIEGEGVVEDFLKRFRGQALGGVLNDWPPAVVGEMTYYLVGRLAGLPEELPPGLLRDIAEKMWGIVKA